MNIIRIPGLADYQETLRMQEELVRAHQDDPEREDELLLLGTRRRVHHRPHARLCQPSSRHRAALPRP